MKLFILDAGGAGLILVALLIFMVVAIVVEAIAMLFLKYNAIGKAFLDSLIINLLSLGVGYAIILFNSSLDLTENSILNFALTFLITAAVEGITLFFLNLTKPVSKTITVVIAINVITYLVLYLFRSM